LLARGRYAASAACFRAALSLAPDHAGAWVNLANALHGLTDSAAAEESLQRVLAMAPSHPQAAKNMLVFGLYRDDLDKCDLAERHRTFGRAFGRCAEVRSFAARPSGERIRLGYLSSDLCDHPVGRAMRHPVRLHDRRRFSLHFFAQQRLHDGITGDFRAAADQWRDIGGLSDDEVARQIRADGIDILVCLAGHFDRNRPLVPAWRAAPVQISLHDVVTSGLREMDYIIGDRWLLPVRGDEYFSETGLRLPQFFLGEIPDDLPRIVNDANRPPMFGCFNNPSKINATALALWGRILNACPDSGLVLKYLDHYDCPATRERILGGLVAAGAQSSQVVFPAGGREPSARLLARYNGIDVALDPMPFSGSTTSFQALSMGVPVVTWPWDRMVSRWTAAMLSGLGLGDIIADGGDSYVATAVRLAKEPVLTRQKLRDRLRRSRLCDAEAWTRHLERLYLTAWRRHSTSLTADNAHGEEDEFGEV
ncbi:MAG TPA: tetratricopeptide repeat protein, partial [Rhodospirillaceae bacterium]|nr:tetratricopeptide repeat protein [Rhodospirillaceae bacterium]